MTFITIHQIDQAKADGRYRYAGQLDALRGGDGHYGAHFGMRSTNDHARREFREGFTEVSLLADRDLFTR